MICTPGRHCLNNATNVSACNFGLPACGVVCSGYRDITAVHSHSEVVQDMRQKQAAANRATLQCQVADIAEGLAFDHSPYAAIIDKVCLVGCPQAAFSSHLPSG